MKKVMLLIFMLVAVSLLLISCSPKASDKELSEIDKVLQNSSNEELQKMTSDDNTVAGEAYATIYSGKLSKYSQSLIKERAKSIYEQRLTYLCIDSDPDHDIFKAGTVKIGTEIHYDVCGGCDSTEPPQNCKEEKDYLIQWECGDDHSFKQLRGYQCPYGCDNGVCIRDKPPQN